MPTLTAYNHFGGTHFETGPIHNFFAYRGFSAPHTGEPYSEALLMGVSGGIVFGYFKFAYTGHDPQCNILTRNTFDPLDTMLARLGVVQERAQTRSPQRAQENLINTLEDGVPAIIWADMWSLPYNALPHDDGMWGAFPLLIFGFEPATNHVFIADRAQVPLTVTPDELMTAWGRIKKNRFRLLTLDAPDPEKLADAVQQGIHDTLRLFTEKPPKGSKNNFGFNALQFWANLLLQPTHRQSWQKWFPPGIPMLAGLTSAYNFAFLFGKNRAQDAERSLYADFLDEAALILARPALHEAADRFRASAQTWSQLPGVLLPDAIQPFQETRQLMWRKHIRFLEQGNASISERQQIDAELATIRNAMQADFPLTDAEVITHRERLAQQILHILDAERAAVAALQEAIS